MLQEFLNAQLLPITDEVYFGKLQKVAETLGKSLQKNKTKVLAYTLTAFDPNVSVENPDIVEVKELITKTWNTFATNTKDSPVTFIRAIMLEALKSASIDTNSACLIWLASRNLYKHYNLIGKEEEIISNFILPLGQAIENQATENWSLTTESKLQKLNIEIKALTGVSIEKAVLQKKLEDASGPSNQAGAPNYESPNPHWPTANNSWSYEFAPRAAQGIADVVNKALKEQAKELTTSQTQIQEAVNNLLIQTQAEILQKNSLLQMRTQLLWWKEASYSNSLKQSYRGRPNGVLQVILAKDYASFVPSIYPVSVDYFLRETHRLLTTDHDKEIELSVILKMIQTSSEVLKTVLSEPTFDKSRITLLDFIKGLVWDKFTIEQINDYVGISVNTKSTLSDFTVWLFHDFQNSKITSSK